MPKLRYSIAGVGIPAQQTGWAFTPGPAPYALQLNLPRPRAKAIFEAARDQSGDQTATECTLDIAGAVIGFEGGPVEVKVKIEKCVVLFADGTASPWEATISIVDRRWWLAKQTFTGNFNCRWPTNDRAVVGQEAALGVLGRLALAIPGFGGGGAAAILALTEFLASVDDDLLADPAKSVELRVAIQKKRSLQSLKINDSDTRYNKETYLPWTVRASGGLYTARDIAISALLQSAALGSPPTAGLCKALASAIREADDNLYVEDNVRPRGEDLITFLDGQLKKAEIAIALLPSGAPYAYSSRGTTPTELLEKINPFWPTVAGGGFVDVIDRRGIRPKRTIVASPTEWDVRWECKDIWLDSYDTTREFYLQNVLKLPDDITWNGKTYRKGTWILIDTALAAWSSQRSQLTANPWAVPELNRQRVLDLWFPTGKLLIAYGWYLSSNGRFEAHPVWNLRMNALIGAFRRTWRMNPAAKSYILNWWTRRTSISTVDNKTFSKPWIAIDHCVVPLVTVPEFKRRRGKAGTNVAAGDVSLLTLKRGAPYTMSIEDQALGVFSFNPDMGAKVGGANITGVIPSQVTDLPYLAGAALGTHTWHESKLATAYSGTVVFACQFGQHPKKFHEHRDKDPACLSDREALYTTVEATSPDDMNVNENLTFHVADRTLTASKDVKGTATNAEMLKDVAIARGRQQIDPLTDGIGGAFTVPGYSEAYRLFGTMQAITIVIGQNGGVRTQFRLAPGQAPRDLFHLLDSETRAFVFQQLPRGLAGSMGS